MSLAPLPELLAAARAGGYAVGYFEAWDSYSLEAVAEAADAEQAPVILGFGCLLVDRGWLDRGGIEELAVLGRAVAERTNVPAALLLNETQTVEQALRGLDTGFNAVMVHGASAAEVAELVREAHGRGAAVEGELGELPDGGDGARAVLTDPEEAAAYVAGHGRRLPRAVVRERPRLRGSGGRRRPRPARGDRRARRRPARGARRDELPAGARPRRDRARRGEVQRRHLAEARVPRRDRGRTAARRATRRLRSARGHRATSSSPEPPGCETQSGERIRLYGASGRA